jgi:hypothetical protein
MFGWFKKKSPPPPPERCSQCGTEVDADEALCPQCGYVRWKAADKVPKKAAPVNEGPPHEVYHFGAMGPGPTQDAPVIDQQELASTAARRHAIRARVSGAVIPPPVPPSARRVAARAMALAAVVWRGFVETQLAQVGNPEELRQCVFAWLERVSVAAELEPQERDLLNQRFGRVNEKDVSDACWRGEGLAVLAWALHRFELPAYDQSVFPPDPAQERVGFGNAEVAAELLASATLRPACEIDRFASHATVVGWRVRQFALAPVPMDFVTYLRAHSFFQETWLENVRMVDGDLAIGAQSIADASATEVQSCQGITYQRQVAAYWLQGDHPLYSKVDAATLLSAC